MKRFMKKTTLLLSIFFVGLFSCSSKSAKESKSISIGGLISKDESAQTSKSIPLEKVPLSYEDENLFLYTFTQEQSAKLVEINRIKHYNNILYKRYLFFKNLSEVDSYYADKK